MSKLKLILALVGVAALSACGSSSSHSSVSTTTVTAAAPTTTQPAAANDATLNGCTLAITNHSSETSTYDVAVSYSAEVSGVLSGTITSNVNTTSPLAPGASTSFDLGVKGLTNCSIASVARTAAP